MKVSVVVPTLNEEKNIERCLKSIRAQTFKNYELIVADGNSDDRTREIAKKYCDKVVIERKRAIAAERQAGANVAKGEIIVFIDADTIAKEDWLENIVSSFNGNVAGVYGKVLLYDGNIVERAICEYIFNTYLRLTSYLSPTPAGMNIAIRKDILKKIGGFDTALKTFEDIDLFVRAKRYGKILFSDATVLTSARRIKKWGYLKFFLFHSTNVLEYNLLKKAHVEYEAVR